MPAIPENYGTIARPHKNPGSPFFYAFTQNTPHKDAAPSRHSSHFLTKFARKPRLLKNPRRVFSRSDNRHKKNPDNPDIFVRFYYFFKTPVEKKDPHIRIPGAFSA
jgi:hypothetical protein